MLQFSLQSGLLPTKHLQLKSSNPDRPLTKNSLLQWNRDLLLTRNLKTLTKLQIISLSLSSLSLDRMLTSLVTLSQDLEQT